MPVIKRVISKKRGSRPLLIDFDNAKIKPEAATELEANLYEIALNENVVAVTSDKMLYTGAVEEDDLYNNFIMVHKKSSDKVKLFQVDHVIVRANLHKKTVIGKSSCKDNAVSELNKQFGSKKAKRVTEQRERLTMNIDAVKNQLESTVATAMSMIIDNIDYNSTVAWRLPTKKCVELKSKDIISGETVTIQFTNEGHFLDAENMNYHLLKDVQKYPLHCDNQSGDSLQTFLHEANSLVEAVENDRNNLKKANKPKKKVHRFPIDGTLYHSQKLGLKVPPKKTLGTRGRIIHSQAREVINNVFKFMKDEAQNGVKIPVSNYRARVLKATGISKCTYSKITTKEFQKGEPQPVRKSKTFGVKVDHLEQVTENDSIYRPKINRDASSPDGVYNLEDLVEGYILDTLAVEAGKIMESENANQFGLCQFSTSNINKILGTSLSEEDKLRNITIFLYIHYIIKFMTTPMKSVTKKYVLCDKSVDVNNHILSIFSEVGGTGRTRPLHMKDKALCYTMILAAIAMDFEVDVQLLSIDLKVGIKKAVEVARILAFNAKANNKHVVQLKLPLPAPVIFTPKGRRK